VPARPSAPRASAGVDAVRRLLCHEPRGHADMYGCFVGPPDDDGADLGVPFSATAGAARARGRVRGGAVGAFAAALTPGGVPAAGVSADVAYGGAIYASVAAADLG